MSVQQNAQIQKPVHPMLILHQQLKDKSLKKSSLESITTISLSLGRKRTRQQLIPYLGSIFVEQSSEIQKVIIKGLKELLHPIYIGKPHHCKIILELIMDILCVYSNKDIRDEAYMCLEKVFAYIDVRKAQNILVQALKRLNAQQNDNNIRELVLKMIPYVYASADGDRQKQLLSILCTFKTKLSDQKLLSQVLTQFIKVMPPVPETEIRQIITMLISTKDKNILANLVQPIILLAKLSDQDSTIEYLKMILDQADPLVICTALKKYSQLLSVFRQENLAELKQKFENYDNQPQQIKNTILQILDSIPISEEDMIKICQPPSSLQLKTTLSETLCRVSDIKGLIKLVKTGDINFQVKLFPKLPILSQMHIEVIDNILNSKSWRQKLAIIQNIEARTEKMEPTHIILPKLSEFIGDKIACIRFALSDAIVSIAIKNKIGLIKLVNSLSKNMSSNNWFERQCVYKIILDLLKKNPKYLQQKQEIKKIIRPGLEEKVINIKSLAEQISKILTNQQ